MKYLIHKIETFFASFLCCQNGHLLFFMLLCENTFKMEMFLIISVAASSFNKPAEKIEKSKKLKVHFNLLIFCVIFAN